MSDGRKPDTLLWAIMLAIAVILALLMVAVRTEAAPLAYCQRVAFTAQMEDVSCLGLGRVCVGWVDAYYHGQYQGRTVRAWQLRDGQWVTLSATSCDGWLSNVTVR